MFANRLHFLSSLGSQNLLFRSGCFICPGRDRVGSGSPISYNFLSLQLARVITGMYFKLIAFITNENIEGLLSLVYIRRECRMYVDGGKLIFIPKIMYFASLLFDLFITFISLFYVRT